MPVSHIWNNRAANGEPTINKVAAGGTQSCRLCKHLGCQVRVCHHGAFDSALLHTLQDGTHAQAILFNQAVPIAFRNMSLLRTSLPPSSTRIDWV